MNEENTYIDCGEVKKHKFSGGTEQLIFQLDPTKVTFLKCVMK